MQCQLIRVVMVACMGPKIESGWPRVQGLAEDASQEERDLSRALRGKWEPDGIAGGTMALQMCPCPESVNMLPYTATGTSLV